MRERAAWIGVLHSPFAITIALAFLNCAPNASMRHQALTELSGTIRNRDGKPIQGVVVFVDHISRGAPTDKHGNYGIRIGPGRHEIMFGGHHAPVPDYYVDTTLIIGTSPVRLDHRYGGYRVSGRVIGVNGKAVRHGEVAMDGDSPESAYMVIASSPLSHGRYELYLHRGAYSFDVHPNPALYPALESWPRGQFHLVSDTTVDLQVGGNRVDGRIRLGTRPLDHVLIRAAGIRFPDSLGTWSEVRTGADGTFRFYLPDGSYRVSPIEDGRMHAIPPTSETTFKLRVNGRTHIDTILPVTWWQGVVHDSATGNRKVLVHIWASDTSKRQKYPPAGLSDAKGRFEIAVRPGTTYVLSWSTDRHRTMEHFGIATAGRDSFLEVRVPER